jgi:hypothetical protein
MMVQEQDRLARVVKLAYELASTGKFEDMVAVKRELVALGYGDDTRSLEKPGIRLSLDEACASGRERDVPAWHTHTSF